MSTPEEKALEDALEKSKDATPAQADATQEPEPEATPEPAEPVVEAKPTPKKTTPAKRKSRTQAQKDKRKADEARRKKAIADAPRAPDPSAEDQAEQQRKAEIRANMAKVQDEIDQLEADVDGKKAELRELSSTLYPHLERSDHHVLAVQGYIARQKELRATRASNPETLKRMLAQAGKAPIDAAMSRKTGRGGERPQRDLAGLNPAEPAAKE
jgi:outer membrane biosynthesis protein TonB